MSMEPTPGTLLVKYALLLWEGFIMTKGDKMEATVIEGCAKESRIYGKEKEIV